MNKFETFLSAIGKKTVSVLKTILHTAVPMAVAAEPFVAIADPQLGPEFALVTNAVAAAEAKFALSNAQTGTGAQKMAAVLDAVNTELLPKLTAAGLTPEQAQAKVQSYVEAAVTLLNTFPVQTAAAGASAGAAQA